MFDDGWFDDDLSVEVAQHPFGPSFGAVHRDDAEMFRSDVAHPFLNYYFVSEVFESNSW